MSAPIRPIPTERCVPRSRRGFWSRWRALSLMGRHERWRVAMGCPGSLASERPGALGRYEPRRGEVYCRCAKCHAARALLGWEPLP